MTDDKSKWNADYWHLFLCQHLDNRATSPNGLNTVALAIADTISSLSEQNAECEGLGWEQAARLYKRAIAAEARVAELSERSADADALEAEYAACSRVIGRKGTEAESLSDQISALVARVKELSEQATDRDH